MCAANPIALGTLRQAAGGDQLLIDIPPRRIDGRPERRGTLRRLRFIPNETQPCGSIGSVEELRHKRRGCHALHKQTRSRSILLRIREPEGVDRCGAQAVAHICGSGPCPCAVTQACKRRQSDLGCRVCSRLLSRKFWLHSAAHGYNPVPRLHDQPLGPKLLELAQFSVPQSLERFNATIRPQHIVGIENIEHLLLRQAEHLMRYQSVDFGGNDSPLVRGLVVSRMLWKLPGGVLRACEVASDQAARSRAIGSMG